ncbi:hypothetical protein SAMN05518672_103135 [Chitinophaga sp. CF118]|nr:hypothetical protein SAMN05518672_103135 [Chitinophaga sp. CF118]
MVILSLNNIHSLVIKQQDFQYICNVKLSYATTACDKLKRKYKLKKK